RPLSASPRALRRRSRALAADGHEQVRRLCPTRAPAHAVRQPPRGRLVCAREPARAARTDNARRDLDDRAELPRPAAGPGPANALVRPRRLWSDRRLLRRRRAGRRTALGGARTGEL